jgi:hypothetical protein
MSIFGKKIIMETTKLCTKCNIRKPKTDFFKDKQKKDGLYSHCKACNVIQSGEWQKKNPEKRKYNILKSATGVSKEQYDDLSTTQDNKCAICGISVEENNRRLSVDHDHTDHIVRGLLCTKCNFGLGYFNDSEALLLNAIDYLHNNLKSKNIKYGKT